MATYGALLALSLVLLTGCKRNGPKKTAWFVTLNKDDKQPYGAYIAYQSLLYYFPAARRESLNQWFHYTSIDERMASHGDSATLLVMAGLVFNATDEEWASLMSFARQGNEILLCAGHLDNRIESALHCSLKEVRSEELGLNRLYDGSENRKAVSLLPDTGKKYGYTGRSLQSYFIIGHSGQDTVAKQLIGDSSSLASYAPATYTEADTEGNLAIDTIPEILGRSSAGPDFIRYRVGKGHIMLHAAPLAFSNYFLLQDDNRQYLDGIMHSLPANISTVYWNGYFKHSGEASHLWILWRYPATRWALIIAICTLLVYVLLGLKRKQRIVPVIPPVGNTSVSFVETVGKLYFNKGNHGNLAAKMVQHFLEWVRTYYFLDTGQLNDTFTTQLTAKSGLPEARVKDLMYRIHEVRLGLIPITGTYLYELHTLIQSFYKNS